MCAITGCMHAVCDEHSSHLFNSDGWPAQRQRVQEVISDQENEYQQAELRGHQHVNARGILARTPCLHSPHSVLVLSNEADDAKVGLRLEKRIRQ